MNTLITSPSSAYRPHRPLFQSRRWRIQRLTAFIERLAPAARPAPPPGGCYSRPTLRLAALVAFGCAAFATHLPSARADVLDSWTTQTAAPSLSANDSLHHDGRYLAVGNSGRIIHTTHLSAGWQTLQSPVTSTLLSLIHAGGKYVVTGSGGVILTSTNGLDWAQQTSGTTQLLRSVAYGNDRYVAVGTLGTVLHSPDAVTWTSASFNWPNFTAASVAFGHGLFVAVGDGANVFTSPDGATWTRRPTGHEERPESITFGHGRFVASGWNRAILTSSNGIDWTLHRPTTQYSNTRFWKARYLNGRYIVGGQYGSIVSSPDGENWTVHQTGSINDISSFLYDGSALVHLRSNGGVRVSQAWAPVSDNGGGSGGSDGGSGGSDGNGNGNGNGGGSGHGGAGGGGSGSASARLINISTRAWVGTGNDQLVSGFVIQGAQPLRVLVRAVGPALAGYGVTGVLSDPQLKLFDGASAQIGSNDDWGTHPNQAEVLSAAAQVGAFALPAGSKDSLLLVTLNPGVYSVHIGGANNGTGIALAEVYAVGGSGDSRLVNISSRTRVGTGGDVTISGFVVSGSGPRQLLIRGVGPSLARFGVGGAIADPEIKLYRADQSVLAENNDWTTVSDQAGLQAAFTQAGAFAFDAGSKDAALVVTVNPGLYSVMVAGTGGATGVGLVEVYQLP